MKVLNTKSTVLAQIKTDILTILRVARQAKASSKDIVNAVTHYMNGLGATVDNVYINQKNSLFIKFKLNNKWQEIEVKL